ncbi:MAG: hypothetical protein RLP15_08220 [Cryomorphaceae bacterium]
MKLLVLILCMSCSIGMADTPIEHHIFFESLGNDQATITLVLERNGGVVLTYESVSGEGTLRYRGKWKCQASGYEIKFNVFRHPNVARMLGEENSTAAINGRTMVINAEEKEIRLWGIICAKRKSAKSLKGGNKTKKL